jgi:alpha-N-arabinofuranosidase
MNLRLMTAATALLALPFSCALAQSDAAGTGQSATLTIGGMKAKSSPTLYGLMTEEINYSYDGGLYAELVRNRVVEPGWGGTAHWGLVQRGVSNATMSLDATTGPSTAIPNSIKVVVTAASAESPAGIENEGYWGIALRPNTTYKASFYAKSSAANGTVTVTLLDDGTGKALASQTVSDVGTDWKQYKLDLQTREMTASSKNHLVLTTTQPGTLWFNLVSLFPPTYKDRVNGNRPDLMEKMADMHPTFLRLPGGNYLEGDHIKDRYEWKKTIGPLVDRPTHPSPWNYRSSDGMGLLEFLEWCEDLKIQPVLAVYAGYSLQGEHVDPGPALEPYVQNALEEIEYVTGDTSTKWGAERAKDGHPEPFKLNYVEIGNEDEFDHSGSYQQRYPQFYDAIKKKYPKLQLIATTPVTGHVMDVLDDHYYKSAQEFFDDVHHYDNTSRTGTKIFVGEWATREGTPTPNFGAALGDAAWMTGMERNSDVIILSSYAPLLTNVNPGGLQWDTDLVGYNAMHSYGSPSYYAQALFAGHHGDEILKTNWTGNPVRLFESATRDSKTGTTYLKLVNATSIPAKVYVDLSGAGKMGSSGTMYLLTAPSTEDTNSITDPTHIVPSQHTMSALGGKFTVSLDPLSINVLEIPGK